MRLFFLALVASSCATVRQGREVEVEFMGDEPTVLDVCQFQKDVRKLSGKCIPYEVLLKELQHQQRSRGDREI